MSNSAKERLYTGFYECSSCDARYQVEDALERDLICDECNSALDLEDDEDD